MEVRSLGMVLVSTYRILDSKDGSEGRDRALYMALCELSGRLRLTRSIVGL